MSRLVEANIEDGGGRRVVGGRGGGWYIVVAGGGSGWYIVVAGGGGLAAIPLLPEGLVVDLLAGGLFPALPQLHQQAHYQAGG